jgi:hypothetical protein
LSFRPTWKNVEAVMTAAGGDDRGCLATVESMAKCGSPIGKAMSLSI